MFWNLHDKLIKLIHLTSFSSSIFDYANQSAVRFMVFEMHSGGSQ